MKPEWLHIADEVADALNAGRPVVGFESTVISHGLPHPQNLELAAEMERIARDGGCVPATIGIAEGKLHVGLDQRILERFATEGNVAKVNLSNLSAVIASGGLGATTVATTMLGCDLAGIEIFATGGIGGVHPGAAEHFDISADLTALSRFRVSVVSAGAKSILDLPATLEALETRGVPVIGMGTDCFPAFHVPVTDLPVDSRVNTPAEAARVIRAHRANPHAAGLILANPIPAEHALEESVIQSAIEKAQSEAKSQGIRGRALTPFLLEALERLTGSASLKANIALLHHNAQVGAAVASALRD